MISDKGTSKDKATSNNEKIKPVSLAVIELPCLKVSGSQVGNYKWAGRKVGGKVGRQAVGQSVENSIEYIFEIL